MTWQDLLDFIKVNEFDRDEYFGLSAGITLYGDRGEELLKSEIWDKDVCWIPIYWVVGSSEGFYIHVDRISQKGNEKAENKRILLGKFWDMDRAQEICGILTKFIYDLLDGKNPQYARFMLIPK